MRHRQLARSSVLAGAGVVAIAALAWTQTLNVKPGLWEVTSVTQATGLPGMDLSKLPADQRAKIEAAVKRRMAEQAAPKTSRESIQM